MKTIKDILINIDKFLFRIDFPVLVIEANPKIPLILERSFTKTPKMLVDIDKNQMKLRIKHGEVYFKLIHITWP